MLYLIHEIINMAIWIFSFILILDCLGASGERTFTIDCQNNQFLKDGEPFRYISGSIHYFRLPRAYWQDRLMKMKAAGLNAIQTYVDWSQHEPQSGIYNFDDNLDVVSFIKMAQKLDLLVILRPGPFIHAERDMGGLPYWLLRENPNMVLRSKDPSYLKFVDRWFQILLPYIKPLIYANGGPIISIQVANEYGSYWACDYHYTSYLRYLIRSLVGDEVILFTTDGSATSLLKCGKIPDVYATVDFGSGVDVKTAFAPQRRFEPCGPLVNSEYYTGWFDHWTKPHASVSTAKIVETLDAILSINASVNMYMFFGGTSFGFTNGANIGDTYAACTTSYDYGAPLSEAGDPTDLYYAIRKVIAKHTKLPEMIVPGPVLKYAYGDVQMTPVGSVFELISVLSSSSPSKYKYPITFEELGQAYGFVLYETTIQNDFEDTMYLNISGIKDRGLVFTDEVAVGKVSRQEREFTLLLNVSRGQKLQILVENQGRVGMGKAIADFKGILGNVTLGKSVLTDWTVYPIPLNDTRWLDEVTQKWRNNKTTPLKRDTIYTPGIFVGSFVVPEFLHVPQDSFLQMDGWFKGVAFINNFNLGRYWPAVGPQMTLYVPATTLKPYPETNHLVMLELENAPCSNLLQDNTFVVNKNTICTVRFVDKPIIDGPTPAPLLFI